MPCPLHPGSAGDPDCEACFAEEPETDHYWEAVDDEWEKAKYEERDDEARLSS